MKTFTRKSATFALAMSLYFGTAAVAQEDDGGATMSPTSFQEQQFDQYEDQLNAILKTRRDEERDFISVLVQNVRAGNIPAKIVQTSFHWVRQKRPNTNFPFIYFEKVLRIQAERMDIDQFVPPFDFGIYQSFDTGQVQTDATTEQ